MIYLSVEPTIRTVVNSLPTNEIYDSPHLGIPSSEIDSACAPATRLETRGRSGPGGSVPGILSSPHQKMCTGRPFRGCNDYQPTSIPD